MANTHVGFRLGRLMERIGEMGLLDGLAGQVLSAVAGQQRGGLMEQVLAMLQGGGLNEMVQKLQSGGLGDAVSSWISTGANLPVSGDQIHQALGQEQVGALAEKLGMSPDETASGLSDMLPQLIDKLTPNGAMPEQGMLEQGLSLLRGKLGS